MTGVVVIHVVLVPLLLGGLLYYVSNTLKDQFISDARFSAGLVASTIAPFNPGVNRDATTSLMDEIILSGNIMFAEIVLADGVVVKSLFDISEDIEFVEDFEFGMHGDEIYFISVPVYMNDGEVIAELRIGFDEAPLTQQLNRILFHLCLIILAYIIVNLVMVFYLGRRMTLPLKKLRRASRSIRNGYATADLDVKSPVTDIRDLAVDLDLMRNELVMHATKMRHQAMHDALTGLPNRLLLEDRMRQAMLTSGRQVEPFALLLMDLDRFKEVNDTLGHHVGDEVLRKAATRLRKVIRKGDTVARLGGDEFAVLLHGAINNVDVVAEVMVEEMRRAFHVGERSLRIGASVGISYFPRLAENTEELLRQADIAMYVAKKNQCHYATYHQDYGVRAMEKLTLNNDLREAVRNQQFVLHYQPKINLQDGSLKGVEALVRWQHPERGLLSPDKFIPLAEINGNITDLTVKLIEIAARDAALWYSEGQPAEISLNLSPLNLHEEALPEHVKQCLDAVNLPAKYFSLEITENAIIQEPEVARDILLRLKSMGVRAIIDDFGTGYSSLVYLRHLPVNEIKIDKSFVLDMRKNRDDYQIVKAIIRMAHDLGLQVTAEGIENSVVSAILNKLGCDIGQGYYYSKALPFDEFNQWRAQYERIQLQRVYKNK